MNFAWYPDNVIKGPLIILETMLEPSRRRTEAPVALFGRGRGNDVSSYLASQSCVPFATLPREALSGVADVCFLSPWTPSGCLQRADNFRYLAAASREDRVTVFDLVLRQPVLSLSMRAVLQESRDAKQAAEDSTATASASANHRGIMCIRDLSSLIGAPFSVAHGKEGKHHSQHEHRTHSCVAVVLVQLRCQRCCLLTLKWPSAVVDSDDSDDGDASGESSAAEARGSESAMQSSVTLEAVLPVPQCGFCQVATSGVEEGCGPAEWRGRKGALVAIPGEVVGSGTYGAWVQLCAVYTSDVDGAVQWMPLGRLQIADQTLRCGLLMSLLVLSDHIAQPPPSRPAIAMEIVAAAESGHALVASCSHIELTPQHPSGSVEGDIRLRSVRCCSEPLMSAVWVKPKPTCGDMVSIVSEPGEGLLYTVSAEGSTQGYTTKGDHFAQLWELKRSAAHGAAVCTVVYRTREGGPVVAIGGWDARVVLLDGSTGTVLASLEFHKKSISSIATCGWFPRGKTSSTLPLFARGARPSRLGQRSDNDGRDGVCVFVTSSEDGSVALWRWETS